MHSPMDSGIDPRKKEREQHKSQLHEQTDGLDKWAIVRACVYVFRPRREYVVTPHNLQGEYTSTSLLETYRRIW